MSAFELLIAIPFLAYVGALLLTPIVCFFGDKALEFWGNVVGFLYFGSFLNMGLMFGGWCFLEALQSGDGILFAILVFFVAFFGLGMWPLACGEAAWKVIAKIYKSF